MLYIKYYFNNNYFFLKNHNYSSSCLEFYLEFFFSCCCNNKILATIFFVTWLLASHLCSNCHHASSLQNICFKVAKILIVINPFALLIIHDILHILKFLFTKCFFIAKGLPTIYLFGLVFMILHIILIFFTIF